MPLRNEVSPLTDHDNTYPTSYPPIKATERIEWNHRFESILKTEDSYKSELLSSKVIFLSCAR